MVLFTGSENSGGYVDVPEELLSPSFPQQKFTLATWMRHKPIDDGTDKHHKEHIICKADDHSKFFSVYPVSFITILLSIYRFFLTQGYILSSLQYMTIFDFSTCAITKKVISRLYFVLFPM